ncbi:MAG: sigma-70 family RNA polymerase sigma factor [Bacteroidota bacterium]
MLAQGDVRAFDELYERWWEKCLDAAFKRLGDRSASEDIVQNLFIRLWENRVTLDIAHVPAYLMAGVRYGVLDHLAKKKNSDRFFTLFDAILSNSVIEKVTDSDSADDRLMAVDLMKWVMAYGEGLPEKRKQVFISHVRDRLTKKEIAEKMGIDLKTVERHLLLALRGLKDHIATVIAAILVSQS